MAESEIQTLDLRAYILQYHVRDRLVTTTDPNLITTSYGYDENNNLLTLTDGKKRHPQLDLRGKKP